MKHGERIFTLKVFLNFKSNFPCCGLVGSKLAILKGPPPQLLASVCHSVEKEKRLQYLRTLCRHGYLHHDLISRNTSVTSAGITDNYEPNRKFYTNDKL
jgi:hypothetical protein